MKTACFEGKTSDICISAGKHTIRLSLTVLDKLAFRLKLIRKFRRNVLTKSEAEIEDFARTAPLRAGKLTTPWWSYQNDVELLLGPCVPDMCAMSC